MNDIDHLRTIVCRCEDVTLADVLRAIDGGAERPNELKALSRAGMGICQARTCGPMILRLLAERRAVEPEAVGHLSYRFPVRPVPLDLLAESWQRSNTGGTD